MLTEQRPFRGDYDQAVIYSILNEEPEPITALRLEVPEDLARVVEKLLRKDPAERFQRADDVLRFLDRHPLTARPDTIGYRVRKFVQRNRIRVAGVAAFVLVGIVAGVMSVLLMTQRNRGLNLEPKRVVVAVLENQTGDASLDAIGRMAADRITHGLSQTGLVEVVPSMVSLRVSQEVTAGNQADSDVARVRAVAQETGAGKVIFGAYYKEGEEILFQVQIMDVPENKVLAAVEPVRGSWAKPMEAIERLRQRVMTSLASHLEPRLASWADRISPPPSLEAYTAFVDGLELFFQQDFDRAIEHLALATTLDSTFATPVVVAAGAYANLGQYAQAVPLVRILIRSRLQLTPLERHMTDWLEARLQGDLTTEIRAMRLAVEAAPGWEALRYNLGQYAVITNLPREATHIIEQIDPAHAEMQGWYPYWIYLAAAYHMLGEYRQELKVAQRARVQYPALLFTYAIEARAFAALGRIDEVNQKIEESLTLPYQGQFITTGEGAPNATPAELMRIVAGELREHGHPAAALEVLERAVRWYQNRPPEEAASTAHRYGLGRTLYQAERGEEARVLFEQLASEDSTLIDYQGFLGTLAARSGEVEKARQIAERLQQTKRPYLFGSHTYWRARIAALLGEHERAMVLLRNAFAQGYWYSPDILSDMDLESLRGYSSFQELLRPKG